MHFSLLFLFENTRQSRLRVNLVLPAQDFFPSSSFQIVCPICLSITPLRLAEQKEVISLLQSYSILSENGPCKERELQKMEIKERPCNDSSFDQQRLRNNIYAPQALDSRPSLIQERQQLFFTTNLALYGDHSCSIILQLAMYVVDMMDGFCPI